MLKRLLLTTALLVLIACPVLAQEELTITKIYSPTSTDMTILPGSGTVHVGGHLLPTLTDTYDFGGPNKLWKQGYLAQLNAILFALQTQTIMGGYSTIGFNAGSFAAAVASGNTTINFGTTMTPGHFVLTRGHDTGGTITAEYFQVGTLVSGTTYNVTRNLSGLGAKNWAQGTPFLVLGTTGTGRIDMLAFDGKPRIQFVEQGATYNAQTVRAVLGNLNGYYGYVSDLNGIGVGAAAGARFTLDPTNGIRIFGGDNDEKVTIDTSGNATFDGSITVGTGRNFIRNADCRVSTENWNIFTNTGLTVTVNGPWTGGTWGLGNIDNDCYISVTGTPAVGTVSQIQGGGVSGGVSGFPVAVGTKYEASAYLGVHRSGNTFVVLQWFNSGGTNIANDNGTTCTGATTGGLTLAGYCRSYVIATAPTNAVYARLTVETNHTAEVDPFIFMVHAYLGEAGPAQEDPTPWGAAGATSINNGLIETDAINARTIAADSITASELAANSITAADILAGTITATQIASGTITASQIAAGTITGTQIAATTITASNLNVSTLSAITANMGTITAGSITGGTIDGATIRAGTGDEVTLDSSGISLATGTGDPNKIKWASGPSLSTPSAGASLYLDGGLTVEKSVIVTGTGAGAAAITVSGGFGISADTLISPSMASSTGTAVIWENACGCLKKQTSSLRYKEHVMPWHITGAQRLLNLTPIRFDYRDGAKGVLGLSAEELSLVAPEAVNLDADGRPDSVRQDAVIVYMLQIMKELRAELDALKAERKQ